MKFNEIAKNIIIQYVCMIQNQDLEASINCVSAIEENKDIFIFGLEVGYLRAEIENLFAKTYNKIMTQKQRNEIYELIDDYAVPSFKKKILGV